MEQISAAKAYKTYKYNGGTLSFTQFVTREKEKMFAANGEDEKLFLVNKSLNDSVQTAIKNTLVSGGLQTEAKGDTIFGISKPVFFIGSALLIGTIIFITINITKK